MVLAFLVMEYLDKFSHGKDPNSGASNHQNLHLQRIYYLVTEVSTLLSGSATRSFELA